MAKPFQEDDREPSASPGRVPTGPRDGAGPSIQARRRPPRHGALRCFALIGSHSLPGLGLVGGQALT